MAEGGCQTRVCPVVVWSQTFCKAVAAGGGARSHQPLHMHGQAFAETGMQISISCTRVHHLRNSSKAVVNIARPELAQGSGEETARTCMGLQNGCQPAGGIVEQDTQEG